MLDKKLLEVLSCPLTQAPLVFENEELINSEENLVYPIREGIPILLVEEAHKKKNTKEEDQ